MTTIVETINDAIEALKKEQADSTGPSSAREFAIAITALEDASMRVNRGMAYKHGRFSQANIEAAAAEEAAQLVAEAESAVHPDQLSLLENEEDLSSAA